jgi:Glyoxalase-like domain
VCQREGGKIAGEKPVGIGKIIRAPRKIRDVRPRYRDLRSAVAQFRAMGFTIKPGRRHQNGIENVSIKFADGSYVELITAHNGTDSLAKQYEEMLKTGEGASYVFLRDSTGAFTNHVVRSGGRHEESGPFAFTELPGSWHAPRLQVIQYLSPRGGPGRRLSTRQFGASCCRCVGVRWTRSRPTHGCAWR